MVAPLPWICDRGREPQETLLRKSEESDGDFREMQAGSVAKRRRVLQRTQKV